LTDVSCWFSSSFEYLTNLDLSHNFLFQLPNSFANLQKLKELNLSNNNFEYFPEPVLELINLQSLNLKSNSLAYIPSEILKLKKNLTELDFSLIWFD
jgi:Leucine-rich repeat (LRR) protein